MENGFSVRMMKWQGWVFPRERSADFPHVLGLLSFSIWGDWF